MSQRREMCIQVISYVIIWSNLLADRVFKMILEAVVYVSPALMNVTKETFFEKGNVFFTVGCRSEKCSTIFLSMIWNRFSQVQ